MTERQGVSFQRLSWAAALLVAVAAAGAYVAYAQLLHYQRVAAEHLPSNTIFAARLDVEQVTLFDPVRRHLLPLVEALPPAPARRDQAEHGARLARLRAAGLNLGFHLREIVVATTADHGWLIVLGGLFPREGMLGAIEQVLHEENASGWRRAEDRLELSPSGPALAQAADGTLILASEPATLRAALPTSARYRELGLAREGAGGAVLTPEAAAAWAYPGPRDWLGGVRRVVASLELVEDIELELRVELADAGRARALASEARQWTSTNAPLPVDLPADGADPAGLWARTRTINVTETSVKLRSSWRTSELDRSFREFAAWVRRQLATSEAAGT